jgi:hypothetical protein
MSESLADFLIYLFGRDLIDMYIDPPRFLPAPGNTPTVSSFVRLQAEKGRRITNLKHETIELGDLERTLVGAMDGSRDRQALLELLVKQVATGKLVVHEDGQPVSDPGQQRDNLSILLDDTLQILASGALFETTESSGSLKAAPPPPSPGALQQVLSRLRGRGFLGKRSE